MTDETDQDARMDTTGGAASSRTAKTDGVNSGTVVSSESDRERPRMTSALDRTALMKLHVRTRRPLSLSCCEALIADVERLTVEKDTAYHERNQLVAVLSKLWPSHRAQHPDDPTWDQDWRTIICIHAPVGQLTWHIHDSERALFAHLPDGENHWDGHTTADKYRRLTAVGRGDNGPTDQPDDVRGTKGDG